MAKTCTSKVILKGKQFSQYQLACCTDKKCKKVESTKTDSIWY